MHVLSYCILGVKSDKFSHNTTYSSWICKINVFSCLFISYSTMMLYSVIIITRCIYQALCYLDDKLKYKLLSY